MSFLSRKPARPDGRGRGDEYDDHGYADDGYAQGDDDGWSPDQYFSPEGIKGKWAGERPAGRSGGRGQRDEAPGSYAADSYRDEFDGHEYGGPASADGPGHGADEFANGAYDLPDGADEDRGDRRRGSRRSRDREDRGERTGILRLRRDRGEDIWPDDGISDEDYWASVAADRPLDGADSPFDKLPAAGGGARPGPGPRAGRDARTGADPRPGLSGADPRFGGDQRGGERGGAGRLGPPPGLSGDYKPGSGPLGGSGQPGTGRTGSGPMAARPGTGPHPVRPATGPTPTVGVTSSRPPTGSNGGRPGPSRSASGSGGLPQAPARPSFQPNVTRSGGQPSSGPGGGRQQDWGDRTERIERVNASGYPDPRSAARGQGPGPAGGRGPSGPLGLGASGGPGAPGTPGAVGAAGRGRGDNPARRAPDRREPDPRAPGRDGGREASGPWPAAPARGGAPARSGDDDPLTSKAYSRAAMTEADGRSYRVAARRSQAQATLTDQAESFLSGQYQQQAQVQPGRGGEYWQYREDPSPAQSPGGRYPAPGGQGGHPSPPGRGQAGQGQAGPGPGAARASQPAFTPNNPARPGQPGAGTGPGFGQPGGQYEAQPRPAHQQRPQPRPTQPQLPAAGPSGGPGGGRPGGSGGLNPYDAGVTGSYPYSGQPYPASLASGGRAQDVTDDPYYRPSAPDGYPAAGPGQGHGRAGQGRPGYASGGYPTPGDRRY